MALRVKCLVTYWRHQRCGTERPVRVSVAHLVNPETQAPVCRDAGWFNKGRFWEGRDGKLREAWESPPPPGDLTCQKCQRWLKRR